MNEYDVSHPTTYTVHHASGQQIHLVVATTLGSVAFPTLTTDERVPRRLRRFQIHFLCFSLCLSVSLALVSR